jgi:hypothetical protein
METALFHTSGAWNFKVDPKCLENLCAPVTSYLSLTSVNEQNVQGKLKI